MNLDPHEYQLVVRYLDDSASDEDRRHARELLLRSPEARAYLLEVASQMVHLSDHFSAYLVMPEDDSDTISCRMETRPDDNPANADAHAIKKSWLAGFNNWTHLRSLAASLLLIAVLLFSVFAFYRSPVGSVAPETVLQISDYLGQLTINHREENFKSPFGDQIRIAAGDTIESHNWLSWGELKLDSGAIVTIPVNSKILVKTLTQERMELDVIQGAVRVKSASNDPFQFVLRSERLHVTTSGSETLLWDYSFGGALAACFEGTAEVTSIDETQKVQVNPGWMATTEYQNTELRLSLHPKIVHNWSTQGMKPNELGTGIWKNAEQPGVVKLLAAHKMYIYPDGAPHEIQEVLLAVWRKPGMVRLKAGSRLIVTGRYTKKSPVSFALRTHSDYGKLLDLFIKTKAPETLAEPGKTWRVEIPVEEMKSTFRPDQNPLGSLLFNISVFTNDEVGLEVNSVELKAPN